MSAASKVKALRQRSGLSVREMADALGIPASSYAAYEDPKKFKKDLLPLTKARQFTDVLEHRGIARAELMALAGVEEPQASAGPPSPPLVLLPVALPSEASLTAMFERLLADVPKGLERRALAKALAQRLPSALMPYATHDAGLSPGSGTRRKPAPPA